MKNTLSKILAISTIVCLMGINSLSALSVPTTMSYEGYLTDSSDEALTGTYSMVFSLYTASTGGSALWTETQPTVSVENGYFSAQLGSVSAITLDFDQQYYLGINIDGDGEMTPRYTLNSTAYAKSADIAFGVFADSDAPSTFAGAMYYDTDNGSIYMYDDVAAEWQEVATGSGGLDNFDDAYDNFGATAAKITLDASESQTSGLEFESQVSDNIAFDLQSTGDLVLQDAGTAFLTFNDDDSVDYTTDLTTVDAWQLAANSLTSGDLLQLSGTSLEGGDALQITTNGTLTGYAINVVSGDALFSDDVAIGAASETLSNGGFSLSGDDLFVSDDFGLEGDIYSDGSIIFGSGLTVTDGSLTQATGGPFAIALGGAAGDDFTVDSTTLVVESDNDRVGIGDASPAALFTVGSGDLFQVDSSGNVTTTKRVETAAHANNVGLNVPTNAGAPSSVTGTVEGDIVWDSTNDALYLYDGAAFSEVGEGGGDSDTLDTLDSLQFLRADASDTFTGDELVFADGKFLALGTGLDLSIYHSGAGSFIDSDTGDLTIDNKATTGSTIIQLGTDTSATSFEVKNNTGTQLLTALGTGNIGIGDTTPDQLLEILSSAGAATQVSITNTNAGAFDAQIGFQLVDGTNNWTIGVDDSAGDAFVIGSASLSTRMFNITPTASVALGDIDSLSGGMELNIDNQNQIIELGDIEDTSNGIQLRIDDSNEKIDFGDVGEVSSGLVFVLDAANSKVEFGDLGGVNNGVFFTLDEGSETISMGVASSTELTLSPGANELELNSENLFGTQFSVVNTNAGASDAQIGFQLVDGTNNYTIGVDDSDSDIFKIGTTGIAASTFMKASSDGLEIVLGDMNEQSNGITLDLDIDSNLVTLGDAASVSGGTHIEIDNTARTVGIKADSAANTQLAVLNTNVGDYDAQLGFQLVDGTNIFTMGVDDSDSDIFKIGTTDLATGTALTITSAGNIATTKRFDTPAHANNVGLNIPTSAGAPSGVTGTAEGDIVWDSTNDALYMYDGSAFAEVAGGGGGSAAGADGQIQYNNGGSAFGGAAGLVWDDINSRLGVGDTSPDQLFEVLSSGAAATQISVTNTNVGSFDAQIGFQLIDGTNNFTMGVDDSDSDKLKIGTTDVGTGTFLSIDPVTGRILFGDPDDNINAVVLDINNDNATIALGLPGSDELTLDTGSSELELKAVAGRNTQLSVVNTNIGAYDAQIGFQLVDGTNNWTMGVDDSLSDVFRIGMATLGDSPVFEATGDNNVIIGDVDEVGNGTKIEMDDSVASISIGDVGEATNGLVMFVDNTNRKVQFGDVNATGTQNVLSLHDTTNELEFTSAVLGTTQFSVVNTNAGVADAQIGFQLVDGTNNFTLGVDDSDADKLKISTTALGTGDALTIDSSGNVGFGGYSASSGFYAQKTNDIYIGDPDEAANGYFLNIDSTNSYVGLGDVNWNAGAQSIVIDGDTLSMGGLEENFFTYRSDLSEQIITIGHYNATASSRANTILISDTYMQLGDHRTADGILLEISNEDENIVINKENSLTKTGSALVIRNDGDAAALYGIQIEAGKDDGTGTTYYVRAQDGDGDDVGYLQNSGGTFSVQDVSDVRTKTNITDTEVQGLDVVNNLRVVDFNRISNPDGERITGFIAQELQPVYDKIVSTGPEGLLSISKENLVPVLVKGMQEQQIQINELQEQMDAQGQTSSTQSSVSVASGEFSSSNVGRVKILAGDTVAHVTFDTEFRYDPIITVSPIGLQYRSYAPDNITEEGFDIVIEAATTGDITFNWHAFESESAKLYVSDGSVDYMNLQVKYDEESEQEEDIDDTTEDPEEIEEETVDAESETEETPTGTEEEITEEEPTEEPETSDEDAVEEEDEEAEETVPETPAEETEI